MKFEKSLRCCYLFILCVFSTFVLFASSGYAIDLESPCASYGDIDLDGYVTAQDYELLANHIAGITTLTDEQIMRANVSKDGVVDAWDITTIARYVGGVAGYETFEICSKLKKSPCASQGDINDDGYVTIEDGIFVSKSVIGFDGFQLTRLQKSRADVNIDGEITSGDGIIIGKYAEGISGYETFDICSKLKRPPCESYGDVNGDGYISGYDFYTFQSFLIFNLVSKTLSVGDSEILDDLNVKVTAIGSSAVTITIGSSSKIINLNDLNNEIQLNGLFVIIHKINYFDDVSKRNVIMTVISPNNYLSSFQIKNMDLNGDGLTDMADFPTLSFYMAGVYDNFDVCSKRKQPPCDSYGDVNDDGYVTSIDYNLAFDASDSSAFSSEQQVRVDVNGNGRFDSDDIVKIYNYIEGTIDTFAVCGGTSSCTDSDGGINTYKIGTVVDSNRPTVAPVIDRCNSEKQLSEKYCDNDVMSSINKDCIYGCKSGVCMYFNIASVTGMNAVYAPREKINLRIKAVEIDGSATMNTEGYNIQYYTYATYNSGTRINEYITKGNYNARYSEGYWYIDYWAPPTEGNYYTEITLYCSQENSKCMKFNAHGPEQKKRITFSVINNRSDIIIEPIVDEPVCGNNICESDESPKTCKTDCPNHKEIFDNENCTTWHAPNVLNYGACGNEKIYDVTAKQAVRIAAYADGCDNCVCYYVDFDVYDYVGNSWVLKKSIDEPDVKGAKNVFDFTPEGSKIKIKGKNKCFHLNIYSATINQSNNTEEPTNDTIETHNAYITAVVYDSDHNVQSFDIKYYLSILDIAESNLTNNSFLHLEVKFDDDVVHIIPEPVATSNAYILISSSNKNKNPKTITATYRGDIKTVVLEKDLEKQKVCPTQRCENDCKTGFKEDGNGCPICSCKELDPTDTNSTIDDEDKLRTEINPINNTVCDGCLTEDGCINQGTRMTIANISLFCSIESDFGLQKNDEKECQNNFECKSNFCSNDVCVDINKQIQENSNILQRIMAFLTNIFSF